MDYIFKFISKVYTHTHMYFRRYPGDVWKKVTLPENRIPKLGDFINSDVVYEDEVLRVLNSVEVVNINVFYQASDK